MSFTISLNSYLLKSDSTSRKTLDSLSTAVGSLDESITHEQQVAVGATAAIPTGGVGSARVLHFQTDQDVIVYLNGDTNGFAVKAGGLAVLINTAVTSLSVENTSVSAANVRVQLFGTSTLDPVGN